MCKVVVGVVVDDVNYYDRSDSDDSDVGDRDNEAVGGYRRRSVNDKTGQRERGGGVLVGHK